MRHTIIAAGAAMVLMVAAGLQAQTARPTTMTGCLQPGAQSGEFVLVLDDGEKYRLQAAADAGLVDHQNHRVELTGTPGEDDEDPVFTVTAVRMVAESCDAEP